LPTELRFHPRVKADIKRLAPELVRQLRQTHLRSIQDNPSQGSPLSGPLKGIYSYHLHYRRNQYRIAYLYAPEEETLTVLMIGKREDFYDVLSRRVS
jgi:mRNA-degrading endonuclease RelE of RelBE toxin-antitoxin system